MNFHVFIQHPLVSAPYPILTGRGTRQSLRTLLWTLQVWDSQLNAESDSSPGESPESQPGRNEGGTDREVRDGMGGTGKRRCLTQPGGGGRGGVRQSFLEAKGREQ